jgi:hypothetical protein
MGGLPQGQIVIWPWQSALLTQPQSGAIGHIQIQLGYCAEHQIASLQVQTLGFGQRRTTLSVVSKGSARATFRQPILTMRGRSALRQKR